MAQPLATLTASAGSYKNWRYAVSLASLLSSCGAAHLALARAGNLNGISLPVLVAKFIPWLMALLISGYWALQAFPTSLVSTLLPWQQVKGGEVTQCSVLCYRTCWPAWCRGWPCWLSSPSPPALPSHTWSPGAPAALSSAPAPSPHSPPLQGSNQQPRYEGMFISTECEQP